MSLNVLGERPTRENGKKPERSGGKNREGVVLMLFFRSPSRVKNEPGSRPTSTGAGLTQERIIAHCLITISNLKVGQGREGRESLQMTT
jgi:hypothetical protein